MILLIGCALGRTRASEASDPSSAWPRLPEALPVVERHGDLAAESARAAADARYASLVQEKLAGTWFAALVSLQPATLNAVEGRFETRRGFFEFVESQGAIVDVWAYTADGRTEEGVAGRRLSALEVAERTENSPDSPTFLTLTFPDAAGGTPHRCRVEFGFQAADEALLRSIAYQRSRNLQQTAQQILSARDGHQRLNPEVQWDALSEATHEGTFPLDPLPPRPTGSTNLFVAFEFAVDDAGNFSRVVAAYREDDVEREVLEGQTRLWLKRPGQPRQYALAFKRTPLGDGLEADPHPITGRDFVELRIENPAEPDPRRWNVLEFGEPEVLQQLSLARFGLINAHLEHRRKVLDLKRANLDMIFSPLFAGLNIGGGVSGVGFPLGAGAQLGYNMIVGPRYIPKVPTAEEMRELFLLLAARQRHPTLKLKPDEYLTRSDIEILRADFSKLTEEQIRETLEGLNDGDLKAMLALAKQANMDAKYTLLVNILSGAAVVSGKAYSGVMRDLFNNPYFSLNGDVYINYIIAAAVGAKGVTPLSGVSLYSLVRGDAPYRAWAQYLGISFDIRALMNSVQRMRFRSLADKELRMPFPYAARMTDLAAYEIRIFGYPVLLFYKRGLMKDDLKAFDNDYAYGLLGRTIVVHFPTRESMESEIRNGRMVPLGYVKVSDGKGGLRDSNLAVFAYTIPDGKHRGQTAMILYGLKAYGDYSATIEREVVRFREYERGLERGMVMEQIVEAEDAPSLPVPDLEPRIYLGETAVRERFVDLLAPLVEWRHHLRRRSLGLPPVPGEDALLEPVRAALKAHGIGTDPSAPDPLLGVQSEGSSFRYVAVINGHRRVVQVTALASLEKLARDSDRLREGSEIEKARKAGVSPGGAGVAFLNSIQERNGRLELGPLIRSGTGPVVGTGLRTTESGLEPVFTALDRMPVADRARLDREHYAGAILDLDADGDGRRERVAVSLEFPLGEIRRHRIDPLTGVEEIDVYERGHLRDRITADRITRVQRDPLGLELSSETRVNRGTLAAPQEGDLIEQTRTQDAWFPGGNTDPLDAAAPRLRRLRLVRVTGDWTRETFGLFPLPVEVVGEGFITTNTYDPMGRLQRSISSPNLAGDDDPAAIPPPAILHPNPGPPRFESTVREILPGAEPVMVLERRDLITGGREIQRRNLARSGRVESGESFDPFDGSRTFLERSVREYDDGFLFGLVPRRVVTTAASGAPLVERRTLTVDPTARRMTGVEVEFTGAVRTNVWSPRWEAPIRVDTALRSTLRRFENGGLKLSGSTQDRDSGEEVARFEGGFDEGARTWVIRRDGWYRLGWTNRTETATYSPGGRLLRSRTGSALEARPAYDADGITRSNLVWFASGTPGVFDSLVRVDSDFRWTEGTRDARVQTWISGSPHDEYRSTMDAEGRVIVDGQRNYPDLRLATRIAYDGGTERVRQSELYQNDQRREVRIPDAPQPQPDGTVLLPVRVTPFWGLNSTEILALGDPFGRVRESRSEDGRITRTASWFPGSALIQKAEVLGRDGAVRESVSLELSGSLERGIPTDRALRSRLAPWSAPPSQAPLMEVISIARGTGVAVSSLSAEGRSHFDLTQPFPAPRYVTDPSAASGVPVRLDDTTLGHVWSISRTSPAVSPEFPGEPLMRVESVSLLPLFNPVRTRMLMDRSGNLLESQISRIPNPGGAGFNATNLFEAPPTTADRFTYRYRYAPGSWVEVPASAGLGRERVLTNRAPDAAASGLAVNAVPWRDQVTSVQGTAGTSAATVRTSSLGNGGIAASLTTDPREWASNPHLPDESGLWTAWTTQGLDPTGAQVLSAEDIYDAQGQLSVRRILKQTEGGAPAIKFSYQLPQPNTTHWLATSPPPRAGESHSLSIAGTGVLGGTDDDFYYFYTRSTNGVDPILYFRDKAGHEVRVGSDSTRRGLRPVRYWPLSPALSQWLPDESAPDQAATVAGPLWLGPGERAYAVSVPELVHAGIDPAQLDTAILESRHPIEATPLRRMRRGTRVDPLRHAPKVVRESRQSPHDFVRVTETPVHRSPAAIFADEDVRTFLERNGRPIAVTQPAPKRSPYPDVVVVATGDTGTPRPLYRLSSLDGHFEQRFETISQGEMVQVYSVVQGFELPRMEIFNPRILGEEISPGYIAYGYDYHARVRVTKSGSILGHPVAVLRNRVAANSFHYAGDRILDWFAGPNPNRPTTSRFHYGMLHHARLQAAALRRLPTLSEAILPTRSLPWLEVTNNPSAAALDLNLVRVAATLNELHVRRFATNLNRADAPTYLIPTMLETEVERFVDTVEEARIASLAIRAGEPGIARDLLEFYRNKSFWDPSREGLEPIQASYDAISGTALARELAFSLPVQSRPTAAAQIAVASAALDLADASGDAGWESFADELADTLLREFRPEESASGPRGISATEYLPVQRALGLVFWPEAARFPVESNADAFALLERITTRRRLSPSTPELLSRLQAGLAEQRAWLNTHVLPEVQRTGVVPTAWFEVQDIYGETTALAPERWTSPEAWLAWLDVAGRSGGVTPETARGWLDNLARAHGARVEGTWGLDWSLPLLRSEAISTVNTARFLRVATQLGHVPAANLARTSLSRIADNGSFPAVVTTATARPLKTEQGTVIYPRSPQRGGGWPPTFAVAGELAGTNAAPSTPPQVVPRARRILGNPVRQARTDLAAFVGLAALYYVGVMMVTLAWWRLRRFRHRSSEADPTLVPEPVMRRAEERWSARVLGVRSPAGTTCTRYSNATVEQNFLMQLRAVYKLVLEWRRRERRWAEDDPRLVEDGTDPWLNGLDEFASVVGIYLRYVIKAGAKDGFDHPEAFEGNEDSNHLWSRLVMYLSEHYCTLLNLLHRYESLPTDQDRMLFEWEFSKALEALGVRSRKEAFDARSLFQFPENPDAMDLLVIQRPGATLTDVMKEVAARLNVPMPHLMRIVENYKVWKRREQPFPLHPYLIEFAKIFPSFVLTGLGALIWYNQSVGDSPVIPYLGSLLTTAALDPASLIWAVPLACSVALGLAARYVRTYRFEDTLLPRTKAGMLADSTVTSIFVRTKPATGGVHEGRLWNPSLYEHLGWILRVLGWSALAVTLFRLTTPSFVTYLIVKGILAMLVITEILGTVVPLLVSLFSLRIQDRAKLNPSGRLLQFLNRLNLTATRPASPIWLSVRYHLRPSVPSGDGASQGQAIAVFLLLNFSFFLIGAYLCQQILPLWFTEVYLSGSPFKLLLGGLVFWNTLYLLRYGIFLLATAVAAVFSTFPICSVAAALGLAELGLAAFGPDASWNPVRHEGPAWTVALGLVLLAIFEEPLLAAIRRWRTRPAAPPRDPETTTTSSQGLGIVYMSGDDLSSLKLTPALLMSRWRLLRDRLGSTGISLLHRITGELDDAALERLFQGLFDLESRHAVTLWNPRQLVVDGEAPSLDPSLGLNLTVPDESQRRGILTAWDARRWLVTMMSTAGHSQDTAINLVDVALRLEREGLAPRTVFYFIQNKYDNRDDNRPSQLKYSDGELGHRDKLCRLIRALAPGARAWSVQNWTPFGFKSAGMTGMDLVPEETMRLGTMVVLDRNATVNDLDAFTRDLRTAMADPDLIIVIPGRGTTNTLTDLGQGSQLIEEGHRSFLKGLMSCLGGRASEGVGTGWGNILTVTYGRVQRAMMHPLTPKMPLTSRMIRGSSFAVRTEGLIGFTPHAVGISEDTWAVSQASHNVIALGGRVKYALSSALWHKIRETWSHAEWMAAFPRWSGGYLQMQHDPLMQRINDFGPASIFAREIRSNSGRNFLSAPFALLNALLLPLAIILDVTPFIQILMLLWNFGFVMNQVLTLHGLNTYLEATGFHRIGALLGALLGGAGAAMIPELQAVAPAGAVLGALYGGFLVGLNRWLVTRLRDIILFGPQLVLHALGQVMRQSIEFVASGAAATDASAVNMAFRTAAGPREDRPLDTYPHFINLRTIVWGIGIPALILNLVALYSLDMFNVLLLLPSLLFSVSLVLGPYLMRPNPGRHPGIRVLLPKFLGWTGAVVFYTAVSLLIAQGGTGGLLGVALLLGLFGWIAWRGGRYLGFHWRWARAGRALRRLLSRAGVPGELTTPLHAQLLAAAGDPARTSAALDKAGLPPEPRKAVASFLDSRIVPFLKEPMQPRETSHRGVAVFQRTFALALLVFLWFFVVPVPGLFVFSAGAYKTSMSLQTILTIVGAATALVLAGFAAGRWVQWFDRIGRGRTGLLPRAQAAYAELRRRMDQSGGLADEQSSRYLALFTDLKTYVDQRSDAYAWRILHQLEEELRPVSNPPPRNPAP
ncbi:MAG: hypothetical protein JNL10_14455 [Verrucomicrobiales bacterium]|nr:hypothetical protein [Verrucomicrobiales bacterium]